MPDEVRHFPERKKPGEQSPERSRASGTDCACGSLHWAAPMNSAPTPH